MRSSGSVAIAIEPLLMATVREEFLKHEDQNVKVLLSFCFYEITRITMPDVPYTDDVLKQVAKCLHQMRFSGSVAIAIGPLLMATVREEFLKHEDQNVKVLLSFCFCEITRIRFYMPDVPYTDDVLKKAIAIGPLLMATVREEFLKHEDQNVKVLLSFCFCEITRIRFYMPDVPYTDDVLKFSHAGGHVLSDRWEDHEENILKSMQSILTSIVDESDEIHESLLRVLLSAFGWKKTISPSPFNGAAMSGRKLARNVIKQAAGKLEPYIRAFLTSSLIGDSSSSDDHIDHHGIILDVYQCIPKTHDVVVPYIIGQLLADDADVRSKAVELLGQLFSLPELEPLFPLFLNRLTDTDTVIAVRVSVIRNVKKWLISNHSQPEALKIIRFDESTNSDDFGWIPGKILKCLSGDM
ncbi:hypothetical protein PR202_ga25284 [Eleusine coracana subsp. coracana]|uniref:Uncharacterized protein n=1 Tax=Eleusine coracana subsp. coracana TaxID=191504 RepID=A0AAV5DAW2_ELECO|nr:hypothetical protein PR202_ga25284 [Eleusine coracana subsp. coracana]